MLDEPGSAREEAERLVAAVLAAASVAANAYPRLSTGSAECCICPLCRVIAAIRDPDPEVVERLASGAGDLAAGVASFLRHVSSASQASDPWHTATSSPGAADAGDHGAGRPADIDRSTAHNDAADQAGTGEGGDGAVASPAPPAAKKPMAKKTVAKKAVAKKAVAKEAEDGPQTTDDTGGAAQGPKKTVGKKAG
jgi:hypothetical protein